MKFYTVDPQFVCALQRHLKAENQNKKIEFKKKKKSENQNLKKKLWPSTTFYIRGKIHPHEMIPSKPPYIYIQAHQNLLHEPLKDIQSTDEFHSSDSSEM